MAADPPDFPELGFPELAAFTEECLATEATLSAVEPDDWSRHGLGSWTLAQLVAHLVRGVDRVAAYADAEPGGTAAACDRVGYFRFDHAAEAAGVAARAVELAAAIAPADLPTRFAEGWRASAERAAADGPARLIATFRGPMRLDEYLATRVLEVVVHHIDVRAALDLPPVPTPAAGRMTMGLLEGLLGGPRPRNLGRTRFILAATGRVPADDERLPVLR